MRSRFNAAVVLVALTAQLLAPLALYASATTPGLDDFCSANRNAKALPSSAPALPRPDSRKHGSSHCALCSGSATPAILPSLLPLPVPLAYGPAQPARATPAVTAATPVLLPPSRGPPLTS